MLSRWRIPMRLGYFAMPLHPPGSDPARTMDDDLVQLATLDRLGYEEAWIGEHFTAQWEDISGGHARVPLRQHLDRRQPRHRRDEARAACRGRWRLRHAARHRARVDAARRVGALDAPAERGGRAAAQPRGIFEIPGSRPRKFPLTAPSTTRSCPLM